MLLFHMTLILLLFHLVHIYSAKNHKDIYKLLVKHMSLISGIFFAVQILESFILIAQYVIVFHDLRLPEVNSPDWGG